MRRLNLYKSLVVLLFLLVNTGIGFTQKTVIKSGAIYTLKSKTSNKLLSVSNASMDNGANVDCWTETHSDAQRWIVKLISKNVYTLTNVASGKLLHIASTPGDSINVDQNASIADNDTKWNIVDDGNGAFNLKTAANNSFSLTLNLGSLVDGTNVNLNKSSDDNSQKWIFQSVSKQEVAPSATIADQVFSAWATKYDVVNKKGFWDVAEMMEIVVDAYEITRNVKYKTMFDQMYNNFLINHGTDWMNNDYNDDITWIVIACTRASLLTGNKIYLTKAIDQFEKMYSRAATDLYEGGLIWKQGTKTKNACINGPAMVACCYLAQATGDTNYYSRAKTLYVWSKKYLFNENTGKVNDAYDGKIHNWSSTYNQGTYLGAAVMLYKLTKNPAYLQDAIKIADYTQNTMYASKVINNENGNDLQGFKGIFMRYARKYVVECKRTDIIPWLQLNAKVAYNNRNSDNLIQTFWGTRTSETMNPKAAFGVSSAVSLLLNCPISKNQQN
jgi:predicted alpha-1,6-mannanase (GH76 family)